MFIMIEIISCSTMSDCRLATRSLHWLIFSEENTSKVSPGGLLVCLESRHVALFGCLLHGDRWKLQAPPGRSRLQVPLRLLRHHQQRFNPKKLGR